jgi:hypothetical protein
MEISSKVLGEIISAAASQTGEYYVGPEVVLALCKFGARVLSQNEEYGLENKVWFTTVVFAGKTFRTGTTSKLKFEKPSKRVRHG